eukprot:TRINITY_DN2786_c1_g1_i1.p1 TRINITY_DN2786_c1_g1~~TRINITY_DN2786_c1_g1_i1.p1  ORF type:complete len:567 (+),score=186.03 TRINITY_DN2786_c1_g1_i1:88-1788(+)
MAREFNNSSGKGKGKGKGRDAGDRGAKGAEKKEEKPQDKVVYIKVSSAATKSAGKSYLDMLKTSSNPPAAPVEKAAPAVEAPPKADPAPVETAKPAEPKQSTPEVAAIQQKTTPVESKAAPVEPKKTIVASQPILPDSAQEKEPVAVAKVVKELLDDEQELPAAVAETLLADTSDTPWGDLTGTAAAKGDDMRPKFAAPTTPTTSPTAAPVASTNQATSKRFHEQSESVVLPCGFEAPQATSSNFLFRASDDRPAPRQMAHQPAIHPTAATTSSAPQQAQPPQQPQHQKPQSNISAGPHSIHQQHHQQFDSIDKDHQHHHHHQPQPPQQSQQPQQQQGRMHWGQGAQGAGAPKAPNQAFPKFSQQGGAGGAVHPPVSQSQTQPPPSNWSQHKSHQPQQPLAMQLQQFSKAQQSVSPQDRLGSADQLRLYEQRMQQQQQHQQQQQKNPMAGRSSGKGQYGQYPSPSQYNSNYSSGMGFPSSYGSAQQSGYGGQYGGGFGGYGQYGGNSYSSRSEQLFNKNISGYSQQQQQQQQQQPQQYWGGSRSTVDYYQGSRSLWAGTGGAPSNR